MALPVQSKTKRSLALLFTVPLAFSLMFFIANTNAENTDIEILTVQNLRSTLHTMFALAQDAETSERGFLLTGDERYLLPYEQAQSQIKTQIELCRVLFKDRPEMKHDADLFTNLVQNKLQAQQKGGFSAALEYVKSGAGQDTMDEIRRINDGLQLKLSDELTAAHDHQRSLNHRLFLFFLVGTAVTIIVLIALYNMLIDYIHGQDMARTELASLNMELNIVSKSARVSCSR